MKTILFFSKSVNYRFLQSLVFLSCLGLKISFVYGQSLPDSLIKSVGNAKTETDRIEMFHTFLEKYGSETKNYYDSLARVTLYKSKLIGYKTGVAKSFYLLGRGARAQMKYDSADYFFLESKQLFLKLKNKKMAIASDINRANTFVRQGRHEDARRTLSEVEPYLEKNHDEELWILKQGIQSTILFKESQYAEVVKLSVEIAKYYHKIGDPILESMYYNNIGMCLKNMEDYDGALKYHEISLKIRKEHNNQKGIAKSLGNMGVLYNRMRSYEKAITAIREAIRINKENNEKKALSEDFNNISISFRHIHQLDSAHYYASKSLQMNLAAGAYGSVQLNYGNLASILSDLKKKEESLRMLDSAEKYALRVKDLNSLEDVYKIRFDLLTDENPTVALLRKSVLLRDSIRGIQKATIIQETLAKYQTEKKDKEIAQQKLDISRQNLLILEKEKALATQSFSLLLQKEATKKESALKDLLLAKNQNSHLELENKERILKEQKLETLAKTSRLELEKQNQELENKRLKDQLFRRNSIIGGGFFLMLIIGMGVNSIRLRKRIELQNAILEQRRRLSADLHDDVGATLSSISIYTEAIKSKLQNNESERVMELVNRIGENSRETISTLGDIVWNLNPRNDSAERLFLRMESTASLLLSSQNVRLEYEVDPSLNDFDFSLEAKQNLYLIFKETVNNTVKYSGASLFKISIKNKQQHLDLHMADNGKGFDVFQKSNGNGLANIHRRAEALGGRAEISSSEAGTVTHIQFPLRLLGKS